MDPLPEPTTIAGYRVLELVSASTRSSVYRAVGPRAGPRTVILKLRMPGTAPSAPPAVRAGEREARMLAAGPVGAMPRLLELGTTADGMPFTVMTECGLISLAAHLDSTAAASLPTPPLLESLPAALDALVRELHEAGVAHGALGPESIVLSAEGAPSLVGFGRTRSRTEPGFARARAADLEALAHLAARLTAAAPAPEEAPSAALPAPAPPGADVRPERAGRAEPVADVGSGKARRAEWDWRAAEEEAPTVGEEAGLVEVLDPAWVAAGEVVRALRRTVRHRARAVVSERRRRLLMVGVAGVVAAVIAASLLLPGSGRTEQDADGVPVTGPPITEGSGAGPTPQVTNQAGATASSPAPTNDGEEESAARPGGTGRPSASPEVPTGVDLADPLEAARVLLERRAGCLVEADAACLDAVTEWGAPARAADLELLRSGAASGGGDPLAGVRDLALVQQLGGVAIVSGTVPVDRAQANGGIGSDAGSGDGEGDDAPGGGAGADAGRGAGDDAPGEKGADTTKPVSLLVMRGETGWVLRSYAVRRRREAIRCRGHPRTRPPRGGS